MEGFAISSQELKNFSQAETIENSRPYYFLLYLLSVKTYIRANPGTFKQIKKTDF